VITQVSLILLLYGTLCGGLAFLSDVAHMLVLKGFPPPTGHTSPQPLMTALYPSTNPASGMFDASIAASSHQNDIDYLNHDLVGTTASSSSSSSSSGSADQTATGGMFGAAVAAAARHLLATDHDTAGSQPGWWAAVCGWLARLWTTRVVPTMQADGRPLMLIVVAAVLYPLCLQKHIREVGCVRVACAWWCAAPAQYM
jgi:hypothetical protein